MDIARAGQRIFRQAWSRRRLLSGMAALPAAASLGLLAQRATSQDQPEEDVSFFRIATGPTDGNYFDIGGLLATAVSNPPGSRPCDKGGACGVPGLVAVAETSTGSVENIKLLTEGLVESALSQCDIAYWAYSASGMYRSKLPQGNLRAIANLYQESLQIVVRAESPIKSIPDLKGHRVSLGERGSGTRATALLVIEAYGLKPRMLKGEQLSIGDAVRELQEGTLDAFFVVGGDTIPSILQLAETLPVRLLPVDGNEAQALREANPFLTLDVIPAGNYRNEAPVVTVGIGTYWLVLDSMAEQLAYELTKSLWHPSTRKILDDGSALGRKIRVENALIGLPIPLHDGAAKYYIEARKASGGN
ncbi:MAG: TAXI family TRAP transporter solute-binding subunit [Dongiaceae bacterium]